MPRHHHSHYKRTLKRSEKYIYFLVLPATLLVAFLISLLFTSLPRLYYNFISNFRIEETISSSIKKGSAVRRETYLRQKYESKWRQDSLETWEKHYENILQSKDSKELSEIERALKQNPLPTK